MSRILIVEDDPNEREGLRLLLEAAGYPTSTAADGIDALQQLQKQHFDLLLVDVWMPRMNGLELLSCLPDGATGPRPPKVIMVTVDDTPGAVLASLREHAYQFITKPIDMKKLHEMIRDALAAPAPPKGIEVISAEPHWVELRLPCDKNTAERVQGFLEQLDSDLPIDVRHSVGVAFHELLMNAVEWGGKQDPDCMVHISYLRAQKMLMYRIADPGRGFDFGKLAHAAVSNPPEHPYQHIEARDELGMRPGGFGILLAKAMVDELLYNEKHNEVVMVKYLPA